MNQILSSVFNKYCLEEDLNTYDPYDIWNTSYGQKVKKVYYKEKWLGIFPAAVLTLFDFYVNNNLRLGYKKRRYPIVQAYQVLINIELYKRTFTSIYLDKAEQSLKWLSTNYSKGYHGICWGINMPWVSKIAVYNENVPHITHTPYVLEAFSSFQQVVGTNIYDGIIDGVLDFLERDLNKIINEKESLAISYSPEQETRIVVNANSYAMLCYALLYKRDPFKVGMIKNRIRRLYNFLTASQNVDGSWYYFADSDSGNFIDCFHSCFVLKNILKVNRLFTLPGCDKVVTNGYNYIKNNFWDKKRKLFRRFSITDRPSLVKFDLYDNAEMLNLAHMLSDIELIGVLSESIENNFISNTDIYSNIIFPNKRINKSALRWATLPYLYALSRIVEPEKLS